MSETILKAETHHHAQDDPVFELALSFINYLGSWILLFAVGVALLNFGLLVVQYFTGLRLPLTLAITQPGVRHLTLDRIKLELGRIVAFSLLLLVAADVLETLLKPMHELSMQDLYKMALVGAIRTTLAYFLGKELEEVLHHISHESHDSHHQNGHSPVTPSSNDKHVSFSDEGTPEPHAGTGTKKNKKKKKN